MGALDDHHLPLGITIFMWVATAGWMLQGLGWLVKWIVHFRVAKTQSFANPGFSARSFFLLCYSESFSMMAVAYILYDVKFLDAHAAIRLCVLLNLVGYLKYFYQMFIDPEYITLSFHVYNFAWLAVTWVCEMDPMYYVLFRYPFHLLTLIPTYIDLRGRKILMDEHSISVHCVDHLIHGTISIRILVYYHYGFSLMLLADVLTVPFCVMMSENLVKFQNEAQKKDT